MAKHKSYLNKGLEAAVMEMGEEWKNSQESRREKREIHFMSGGR